MIDLHEAGNRLAHCAKNAGDEQFLELLNKHLSYPQFDVQLGGDGAAIPAIYIVGAPRSGTTLLSQVVSRYLPVGYINNLIARFWLRPSVGIRLSSLLLGEDARTGISFSSKHGVTDSVVGPHEFGYFWAQGFRLNETKTHHLTQSEIALIDKPALKKSLENEMLGAFGKPVVFKNVICGFQAPLLTELHRNSLFIHISRDIRSTCASILKSRFERYGDYETWWSLKPSTFESLPKEPVKQVIQQVIDCRTELQRQIAASGAAVLDVCYEEFCLDPNALLKAICRKLELMGCSIEPNADCPQFVPGRCSELPEVLMSELDCQLALRA